MKKIMPDFTKNLDSHFNNKSVLLRRLVKQHPIQNEKKKTKELKLLIFAYELLWICFDCMFEVHFLRIL